LSGSANVSFLGSGVFKSGRRNWSGNRDGLGDCIHLYHGNASLLAESLEVIQQTSAVILAALQPPKRWRRQNCEGGVMQTILEILERAAGYRPTLSLMIENPPYMVLVIKAIGPGPLGLPGLPVAHYGEQNGNLLRDPEMCFELSQPIRSKLFLDPYYWRNDYVGVEQWSPNLIKGHYLALLELRRQHELFAADWDNVLRLQGFAFAFERGQQTPRA
jgi:hypothetical protein